MIYETLGEGAVSSSTCKKWFQMFRNGNFNLENSERSILQPTNLESVENNGPRPIVLLHGNARPHTAKATKDMLDLLAWEISLNSVYSPDLAPPDFHFFQSFQHYLTDSHFKMFERVQKGPKMHY